MENEWKREEIFHFVLGLLLVITIDTYTHSTYVHNNNTQCYGDVEKLFYYSFSYYVHPSFVIISFFMYPLFKTNIIRNLYILICVWSNNICYSRIACLWKILLWLWEMLKWELGAWRIQGKQIRLHSAVYQKSFEIY